MGHGDACPGWAPPTLGSERLERVWQVGTHPVPITVSGLQLHPLNFGLSAALINKTIASNNTRAATRSQPASASCRGRLGPSGVTSHRHTALCKVTVPVPTTGHAGPRSQPLPRGPYEAGHRQSRLLLHFGKLLGGFPNASAWQLILTVPVTCWKSIRRKFKACIPKIASLVALLPYSISRLMPDLIPSEADTGCRWEMLCRGKLSKLSLFFFCNLPGSCNTHAATCHGWHRDSGNPQMASANICAFGAPCRGLCARAVHG